MDHDLKPNSAPVEPEPAPTEHVPVARVSAAVRATAPRRGNARLLNLALGGALVLAIGGVAFAAGRMTAPAASAIGFPGGQGFNPNGVRPGASGAPGGFGGAGATIEGTVESITDTTLTLKTADGQTIQVALSGTTTYHAQTDASSSDVAPGGKVMVRVGFRGAAGTGSAAGAGNLSANDVIVVP